MGEGGRVNATLVSDAHLLSQNERRFKETHAGINATAFH